MFRWNTDKIKNDLSALASVNAVEVTTQGGDVDTNGIIVSPVGSTTNLFLCGFVVWDETNQTPGEIHPDQADDCDVEMIELTDGHDSSGGLNVSCRNAAQCFFEVRQYFVDQGASVVDSMDGYF